MNLAGWVGGWRRWLGGRRPSAETPHIVRITYTIDLQRTDRVYLSIETRLRAREEASAEFLVLVPAGLGAVEQVQSSPGRPVIEGPREGLYPVRVELPEALAAGEEITHLLTARPKEDSSRAATDIRLRPAAPAEAIGLSVTFPLTRPPRGPRILAGAGPAATEDPTPLQATPRADGRAAFVWLKESPPPEVAYRFCWEW